MKIYLASSWRNEYQPTVLASLRAHGHEVYDFRNPAPDNDGFRWAEIADDWQSWTREGFRAALDDPISNQGFKYDFDAMEASDAGVLLLPSGRSAHLEAGYFAGHPNKSLHILMMEDQEPELMYKMGDQLTGHPLIHLDLASLVSALKGQQAMLDRADRAAKVFIQAHLGPKLFDLGMAFGQEDAKRMSDVQIEAYGYQVGEAFGKLLLKWRAGEIDG